MLLSVIVPTCNRNDCLAACLAPLGPGEQTLDAGCYEIVVSDDSLSNAAKGLIDSRFPWAKWIQGPCRGPAANRNNGAAHSCGDWLVFVDDDCVPEPGLLKAYADGITAHPEVDILEGRTFADRPRRSLAEVAPINETGGYLWSCNFAIRRSTYLEMNGFDERFPFAAMEDVDFRHRLNAANLKSVFLRDAAVCHPWRVQQVRIEAERYERSLAIFLDKYHERISDFTFRSQLCALIRGLIKDTLPGIVRYRGAGIKAAALQHYCQLRRVTRSLFEYGF